MYKVTYCLLAILIAFSTIAIAQPTENPIIKADVLPPPTPPILLKKTKIQLEQPAIDTEEEVFTIVEEMPRFAGCEDIEGKDSEKKVCAEKKMLEFIYSNIKYPPLAREKNIDGTVVIRFVVDEKGNVIQPKVVRDIGGGCGREGLRVVQKMPAFTPGKQRGKVVKVQFSLPIHFKLEGKKAKKAPKPIVDVKTWTDLFCIDFSSGFIDDAVLKSMLEEGTPKVSCDKETEPHHFHVMLMGKGEASEVKKKKWGKRMNKMLMNATKGSNIVIHYDEGGKLITKNITVK